MAQALGARAIAVVSTKAKAAAPVADAGGSVLFGFDAVAGLAGGRGVDVVIDMVGGDVFADSLRCLGTRASCS